MSLQQLAVFDEGDFELREIFQDPSVIPRKGLVSDRILHFMKALTRLQLGSDALVCAKRSLEQEFTHVVRQTTALYLSQRPEIVPLDCDDKTLLDNTKPMALLDVLQALFPALLKILSRHRYMIQDADECRCSLDNYSLENVCTVMGAAVEVYAFNCMCRSAFLRFDRLSWRTV